MANLRLPDPQVQVDGVGVVGAEQFNTFTTTVTSYAQLRTFPGIHRMSCLALGQNYEGDGGESFWWYDSTSIASDNNISVIAPTGTVQGRWLRNGTPPYGSPGNPGNPDHWPNIPPTPPPSNYDFLLFEFSCHLYTSSDGVSWTDNPTPSDTLLDNWSDMTMAINDADYSTVACWDQLTHTGSPRRGFVEIATVATLPTAPLLDYTSGSGLAAGMRAYTGAITAGGSTILTATDFPTSGGSYPRLSTDSGSTWSNVTGVAANVPWRGAAFSQSASIMYLVAIDGSTNVQKSTDGGTVWISLSASPLTHSMLRCRCSQNGHIFAFVDQFGNFNLTTDSGATWVSTDFQAMAGYPDDDANNPSIDFGMSTDGSVFFVSFSNYQTGITVDPQTWAWKSTDGGATWNALTINNPNKYMQIAGCSPDGQAFVIAYAPTAPTYADGVVEFSTDQGSGWTTSTFSLTAVDTGGLWTSAYVLPALSLYPPPPPRYQTQNQGAIGAGQYNFNLKIVTNYDGLREFPGIHDMVCMTLYNPNSNAISRAFWWYDSTNIALDNNLNCIAPTGTVQGRWLQLNTIVQLFYPGAFVLTGNPATLTVTGGGYKIYLFDDTCDFFYSSDSTFSTWAFTTTPVETLGDSWPDLVMAINDADYNTLVPIDAEVSVDYNPDIFDGTQPGIEICIVADMLTQPILSVGAPSNSAVNSGAITANAQTILLATDQFTYPVLSTDTGATWSDMTGLPSGLTWVAAAFSTAASIMYIAPDQGVNYIYKSADGGSTWSALSAGPTGLRGQPRSRMLCSANGAVVVGYTLESAGSKPVVYTSANSGAAWTRTDFSSYFVGSLSSITGDISMKPDGSIILFAMSHHNDFSLGYASSAFLSTDHGSTWTQLTVPQHPQVSFGTKIYACAVSTDGAVLGLGWYDVDLAPPNAIGTMDYSTDNGVTWTTRTWNLNPTGNSRWVRMYILPNS